MAKFDLVVAAKTVGAGSIKRLGNSMQGVTGRVKNLRLAMGGLNKTFDWSILKNWKGGNYYLSGGLNENNINDAVNSSNASVIDVSSGVESEPGLKDRKKLENFVKLTRLAYKKKL